MVDAKTKKLIIAAGAAIIILIAALVALALTAPADGGEAAQTTSTAAVSRLLYEKSPDAISRIDIKNFTDDFSLVRNSDGEIGVEGYGDDVELYTAYINYIFEKSSSLVAQKTIEENASDLSKYGLKKPAASVTVTFSNGDKKTINVGDAIPMSDGCYYMCFEGEKTVYSVLGSAVSIYSSLTKPAMISTLVTNMPYDEEGNLPRVREMYIVRSDIPYDMCMSYDETAKTYILTAPVELKLTETTSYILPNGLYGIAAMSTVRYQPSESDLEKAGLAEPAGVIKMTSDSDTMTLLVGSKITAADGTASYLAMLEGDDKIFQISSDVLPWMTIDVSDIAVSYVFRSVADDISKISIEAGGEKNVFTKTGSYTEETAAVKWNGQETDANNLLKLYKFMFAFRFERISTDETLISGEPIATMTVTTINGSSETLEFYDIGNMECAVTYNGKASFVARKAYVDRLIANLELLENGEELVLTW